MATKFFFFFLFFGHKFNTQTQLQLKLNLPREISIVLWAKVKHVQVTNHTSIFISFFNAKGQNAFIPLIVALETVNCEHFVDIKLTRGEFLAENFPLQIDLWPVNLIVQGFVLPSQESIDSPWSSQLVNFKWQNNLTQNLSLLNLLTQLHKLISLLIAFHIGICAKCHFEEKRKMNCAN